MDSSITLGVLYRLKHEGAEEVMDFVMNDIGLISNRYKCPVCGRDMKLVPRKDVRDKVEWSCRNRAKSPHRVKRSVRSGTWFERCNLPVIDILLLSVFLLWKAPHSMITNQMKLSEPSVCEWHGLFRQICLNWYLSLEDCIGGADKVVEMDVCKFGKGEGTKWVLGVVERGSRKAFFRVLENRDEETLLSIVKSCVLPGTTIYSDCSKAYDCLEAAGFKHQTVDRACFFKDPESGVHTNAVQGTWSAIRRSMPSHIVSDQLDSYLAEYIWHRSHVHSECIARAFFEEVRRQYPPKTEDALHIPEEGNVLVLPVDENYAPS